jgi:hypothetical protein
MPCPEIAIGNSRKPALAPCAERLLNDTSANVVLTLGRLVGKQDLAALGAKYASAESDPSVRDEWVSEGYGMMLRSDI